VQKYGALGIAKSLGLLGCILKKAAEQIDMKAPQGKAKSPSTLLNPCLAGAAIRRHLTGRVPLYKRRKVAKWFQQIPPFIKGGLGLPAIALAQARRAGRISNQKGYTLVEVLVALGILGFGLMAVATMQVTAIKTNSKASDMSQGLTLAQAKVEELMNLQYTALSDTDGDGTNQDPNNDGTDDDGGNFGLDATVDPADECVNNPLSDGFWPDPWDCTEKYRLFWNVAVDEPATKSKIIRVIVIWTERGKNKRMSLDFVKTDLS
jgi:prepilin-type N-terminal cleavage/methylation domain-containing protein